MSAAPSVPWLFVYGSLRVGSANPHAAFLHSRCRIAGPGKMPGRLFRNGTVHGALYEPDSITHVVGDVLELPGERAGDILGSLDRYEGIGPGLPVPQVFARALVHVLMEGGGRECWAWLYTQPVKGLSLVRNGDALKRD